MQRSRAVEFATSQHSELRVFSEQASAKNISGRPVMTALLAEISELPPRERPRFVFVTALDRLFRDMIDGMYIGNVLRNLKISLYVYGRGEIRLDSFIDRAMFATESMGGDAENEAKAKRARDSWERRRREGKPTSNKVPYGLQLQGERDIPIPESAEWVRLAFEWYAQGIGTHVIGKRMQGNAPAHTWLTSKVGDDGERISKTRAGTRWEALRVTKLLRQVRYRGTIVEPELFDAVHERLSDTPKSGSRRRREYPLSGAMRCEGCGRHLHGRATGASTSSYLADGTKKVYRRDAIRYYSCVVCHYMLNADRLEAAFFSDIGLLVADQALLTRWISASKSTLDEDRLTAELERLKAEIDQNVLQAQRDQLFRLALSVSINEHEFKRQMDRLDAEFIERAARAREIKSLLETKQANVRNAEVATKLLSDFHELYASADYDGKRELILACATALGGLSVSSAGISWPKHPARTLR